MSFVDDETQVATADDPVAKVAPGPDVPPPSKTIGRYMVIGELGRGGMGVVYAAYDPELDRKVAIKLLRRGVERDGTRLRREAQAMARLSHPNVVVVFDVGQHEGRLFLAMDFVDGQTLKAWLDPHDPPHLGIRPWFEILDVFVQAGRGLAAAHAAGLVHRDFKPDNVLVSNGGEVKVVDFGIAKEHGVDEAEDGETDARAETTDQVSTPGGDAPADPTLTPSPRGTSTGRKLGFTTGGSALGTPLTMTGSIMGTPAYMSPEQHRGRPTDARTDQFSFAVSLWEALVGSRPFEGETQASLRFHVCKGTMREAPRDTEVPGYVFRALRRALSVDPADRFESMAALLEALTTDPHAQARRRWTWVGGTAATLGVLLGLAVWSPLSERCDGTSALKGAWDEDDRARLRQRFEASGLGYAPTAAEKTVAMLDARAEAWAETYEQQCARSESERFATLACLEELRQEMEVTVEVLTEAPDEVLASTIEHAADTVAAMGAIDACTSTDVARALARVTPPSAEQRSEVNAIDELLARAKALGAAQRFPEMLAVAREAAKRADALGYAPAQARAQLVSSRALLAEYENEAGIVALERAINLAHRAFDDVTMARGELALSRVMSYRGNDQDRSARLLDRAASTIGRIGHDEELELELLDARGTLAQVRADYEASLDFFTQALERRRAVDPPDPVALARALDGVSTAYKRLGDQEAAERHAQEAYDLLVETLGPDHPGVTGPRFTLGRIHRAQKKTEASIEDYLEVVRIRSAAFGPDHPSTLSVYNNLANAYSQAGKDELALEAWSKALETRLAVHGPDHPRVATVRMNMGSKLTGMGRLDEARQHLEAAHAIHLKTFGADHRETTLSAITLAELELADGHPDVAMTLALDALTRMATTGDAVAAVGDGHFVVARALAATGGTAEEIDGAISEAALLYEQAGAAKERAELEAWRAERAGETLVPTVGD